MSSRPGIWFVYRSHYEGPLSKRVKRLDAASVVEWFAAKIDGARGAGEPRDLADKELGGYVYGLGTLFEAAKGQGLKAPRGAARLETLLRKHLYVEGGKDNLRLNEHSLRVLTNDDEVNLAYFFFDDEAARRHPERLAYLLHDEPRLPEGAADGPFKPPVSPPSLGPEGDGEGVTYACLLTFHDGDSLPGAAAAFPGVRLPGLAGHLRKVVPDSKPQSWSADWLDTWPLELRLLRAMLEPGDARLAPALARAAAYPVGPVVEKHSGGANNASRLGAGPYAAARDQFAAAAEGLEHEGEPGKSIVYEGEHAALLCVHASTLFGHQQWALFDDRWAAAHPDLASSMLHYATSWDPFPRREPKSPADLAASKAEREWRKAVGAGPAAGARAYKPGERFAEGDLVEHAKFGLGAVRKAAGDKIEVVFRDGARTLVHGQA